MSNMMEEFATEVQGRLDKGYTLEQALQPLFGHIVLDERPAVIRGQRITEGLLFDRLEENFIVAMSTEYAKDDVTPIWIAISQFPELAPAYELYLKLVARA